MLNYKVYNNVLVINLYGELNARLLDELAILTASQNNNEINEVVIDFTMTKFIKIGAILSIVIFIEYLNKQKDDFGDNIFF